MSMPSTAASMYRACSSAESPGSAFAVSRQDRDAVPGLFSAPNCRIASLLDRSGGKVVFRALQFLQANHIGLRSRQPVQQVRQPAVDVVDIEGRDFHPAFIAPGTGRNDLECSVRKGRSLRGATGILDALIS